MNVPTCTWARQELPIEGMSLRASFYYERSCRRVRGRDINNDEKEKFCGWCGGHIVDETQPQ